MIRLEEVRFPGKTTRGKAMDTNTYPSEELRDRRVGGLVAIAEAGWRWLLISGVVTLIVGQLALWWPGKTLAVLAVLFGLQLIVIGIVRLVDVVTDRDPMSGGVRVLRALVGILAIAVGIYAVRHIALTLAVLALLLGIFWIVDGVTTFAGAFSRGNPHRVLTALTGVLGIIAGLILAFMPLSSLLVLAIILGVWLSILGVLEIIRAIQIRRHLNA